MTRAQLEHIISAAGAIANTEDLVVIGSQAVLGQFPNAPAELLVSNEADVLPRADPSRSDLIDATIGQGSPFQRSFGYFAHGIDEGSAILPDGWRERLVLVSGENTRLIRGWCLETHDLGRSGSIPKRESSSPPESRQTSPADLHNAKETYRKPDHVRRSTV
jgi:hypothetical protein